MTARNHLPRWAVAIISLAPTLVSAQTQYGFFDQGFLNGNDPVASDYYGGNVGSSSNPLQVNQCIFNDNGARCNIQGTYPFPQTNYWSQNWNTAQGCVNGNNVVLGGPCGPNWIIMHNVDGPINSLGSAYSWEMNARSQPNGGPPDQSIPLSGLQAGLIGYQLINYTTYDNINRPTIDIDMSYMSSQGYPGALPYVAFGAIDRGGGYGNGHPIGALNPTAGIPHILRFVAHMWENSIPANAYGTSGVTILAKWGTVPKGLRVFLSHTGPSGTGFIQFAGVTGAANWSWPFPQSAWYPGAKFAEINVENIASTCSDSSIVTASSTSPTPIISLNDYPYHEVSYTIDVQKLFVCANSHGQFSDTPLSEPMPSTANIPISGVLWELEAGNTNTGLIYFDAHSMSMAAQ